MKCPEEYILLMHEYLDEELSPEKEKELSKHLSQCPECHQHFQELEKSIALVKGLNHLSTSDNFTMGVMNKLPKEKKKVGFQRWFRHHPLLTAASLFLILMMGSFFTTWNKEQNLSVSKQPNLVVENDTVIVPEGEVIYGDVVVKNGKLRIEGQVEGNVTVINGEKYMASAGQVSGQIYEVDQFFEWLWYQIKSTTKQLVQLFEENKNE